MSGYQYDCREAEDDFGDNKRDRRAAPTPEASAPRCRCGVELSSADLLMGGLCAACEKWCERARAATVAPRCTTCGEPFGTERGKFCSSAFHVAPEASAPPCANPMCGHPEREHGAQTGYCWAKVPGGTCQCAAFVASRPAREASTAPGEPDTEFQAWLTTLEDMERAVRTDVPLTVAPGVFAALGRYLNRLRATVAALTADRARLAELREDELAAIYREHARIVATLEARLHDAERDAERWRAIVGCQRVRVLGYARLGQPDQHIGVELWEQYPPDTIGTTGNEVSRADLTTFADAAAVRAPRGTAR